MENKVSWLNIWIYLITGLVAITAAIDVEINQEVVIMCPIAGVEYPEWTGPDTLASPLTNGTNINEPGFEWVDKKNLKILSAQTKHTGQYKCSSNTTEGLGTEINVLTYNLRAEFLDTEVVKSTNIESVVGKINTVMTVICQVNGGNPAPDVSIAFAQDVENPPVISTPLISKEMTDANTYSVNISVQFMAIPSVDFKDMICKASYPNKDPVQAIIPVYLLIPPSLFGSTVHKLPTEEVKQMVVSCDTSSKPETTFNWKINGTTITDSELAVTEDYQGCTQNSTTLLYFCMSNITISDIKKEDNGKMVVCEYIFRNEIVNTSPEKKISLPFKPANVTITGNASGIVDSSGSTKLTLTCSSDTAYPPASLKWYLGADKETPLSSTYDPVEEEGMYGGKNVSQDIDVVANRTMNEAVVVCCATQDLCTSVTLSIQYPPMLLAPQLSTYRAYVGDNISIPCVADSRPVAHMAWYRVEGNNSTQLSNNTDNPSNIFYLQLVNVTMSDAVMYECRAWSQLQAMADAVSKSTSLGVFERPADPVVETTFDADKYYIEIKTSADAPAIPRQFYIQYRKTGDTSWLEVGTGFDDTLPGQGPMTYSYGFMKSELSPESEYEFRVKSVDQYGLITYSSTSRVMTDKEVVPAKDDTVSMTKYRNAIIISVFATAAFFLIILIIVACAVKHGKCGSSSSKSYVM